MEERFLFPAHFELQRFESLSGLLGQGKGNHHRVAKNRISRDNAIGAHNDGML
jgi:hypothetical protein